MQKPIVLLITALALTNATLLSPRLGANSFPLVLRQTNTTSCASQGGTDCDDGCMPLDGICCNDGSATYCDFGYRCESEGCCPFGKTCTGGGGGTQTVNGIPSATATGPVKTPNAAGHLQISSGRSFLGGLALAVGYIFI